VEHGVVLYVLAHGEVLVEAYVLLRYSYAASRSKIIGGRIVPVNGYLPGSRPLNGGYGPDRSRLAGSVRAKKTEDLTALDAECQSIYSGEISETYGQAIDFDYSVVWNGTRLPRLCTTP